MKLSFFVVLAAVLATTTSAQNPALPEVLRPDRTSIAQAEQSGVHVFKLLPRGMFKSDKFTAYEDEENPLGIREGGSYYSFSTGAHSYNRIPQIGYEGGLIMAGGFYGANYGFIRDLGAGSLSNVSLELGVPKFLVDYKPPVLHDEIRVEQRRSHKYETDGGVFIASVPAAVGHVYVLRSINFGEADILVAFRVEQMEKDGSLTIGWKKIKEFDVPKLLFQTDEALRAKVADVLGDPRYTDVVAVVKDDRVTLTGSVAKDSFDALLKAIKEKANPRSLENRVVKR
jgi:hypothetical protein